MLRIAGHAAGHFVEEAHDGTFFCLLAALCFAGTTVLQRDVPHVGAEPGSHRTEAAGCAESGTVPTGWQRTPSPRTPPHTNASLVLQVLSAPPRLSSLGLQPCLGSRSEQGECQRRPCLGSCVVSSASNTCRSASPRCCLPYCFPEGNSSSPSSSTQCQWPGTHSTRRTW